MAAPPRPVRIATRGSALALAQAQAVLAQCRQAFPDLDFELTVIKTTGDQQQSVSLAGAELPKGLFTKEIETALLRQEADLAVHSLKDLPTELPAGLVLGAVSRRADVRDMLIRRIASGIEQGAFSASAHTPPAGASAGPEPGGIAGLPPRGTVATSSTRRAAQICEQRPDLRIVPIRGNVGTRLKKLAGQPGWDATVLAAAGLERLEYWIEPDGRLRGPDAPDGLAAAHLSLDEMLPCVGQAALGLEIREHDAAMAALCAELNDYQTGQCVTAERAFLNALGGGCHLAVAAYAEVRGDQLQMRAVSFLEGTAVRCAGHETLENAEALGRHLARAVMGKRETA